VYHQYSELLRRKKKRKRHERSGRRKEVDEKNNRCEKIKSPLFFVSNQKRERGEKLK
jgi:hypothetical protein